MVDLYWQSDSCGVEQSLERRLTVSREALVKIENHAWNAFPLESFGFLLGRLEEMSVYAALPCSQSRSDAPEDRWNSVNQHWGKAQLTGKSFRLEVVGYYASSDAWHQPPYPVPDFIASGKAMLLLYQTVCCRGHSWKRIWRDGTWLKQRTGYVVPRGIRISNDVNQKRVLKAWRQLVGDTEAACVTTKNDMQQTF